MAVRTVREGDTLTVIERKVVETRTTYKRHLGGWQLPCGCIGPAVWISNQLKQAFCDACGRGWWLMGVKSNNYCVMLDGKPQGQPLRVFNYVPIERVPDDVAA